MALETFDSRQQQQQSDLDISDPDEVSEYLAEQGWRTHNRV